MRIILWQDGSGHHRVGQDLEKIVMKAFMISKLNTITTPSLVEMTTVLIHDQKALLSRFACPLRGPASSLFGGVEGGQQRQGLRTFLLPQQEFAWLASALSTHIQSNLCGLTNALCGTSKASEIIYEEVPS